MDRIVIFEKLTMIFRKIFSDDTIILKNELTANDVANWDSLSHMLMIGEVETVFALKFRLKELNKLADVKGLVDLIESKLNDR